MNEQMRPKTYPCDILDPGNRGEILQAIRRGHSKRNETIEKKQRRRQKACLQNAEGKVFEPKILHLAKLSMKSTDPLPPRLVLKELLKQNKENPSERKS